MNFERGTAAYQIRRDAQYFATKVFGYRIMTKVYYKILLHTTPDLKNPKTLNEKINWLKLNDFPHNPLVIQCADKYRVREYVTESIGEEYLVPLIGVWDKAEDINYESLPDKFILKCNHGCAYNILVDDKKAIDTVATNKRLSKWLKEDFSYFNAEPQYHKISRKIICEKHLGQNLIDYKFWCLNGKTAFYYITSGAYGHASGRSLVHYYPDGSRTPFQREGYGSDDYPQDRAVIKQMMILAEKLAKPFPFVRVDFFMVDGHIYFSELTFTPGGGFNAHKPQSAFDKEGDKLDISGMINKK